MKRTLFCLLLTAFVTAGFTVAAPGAALAAPNLKPVAVMMGSVLAETHPLQVLTYYFQKRVDELAPGRVVWKNYINSAMGGERDLGESVLSGTLQGAVIACSTITTVAPMKSVLIQDTPFFFKDVPQVYVALNDWYRDMLDKEYAKYDLMNTSYLIIGGQEVENTVRPLKTPEDIKGLKIRIYASQGPYKFLEACGGLPISMDFGEVYTAIQQKTIDGVFTSSYAFVPQKFVEVTKYHTRMGVTHVAQAITFNKAWFEKLPKDLQEAFIRAGRETEEHCRDVIAPKQDDLDYAAVRAAGVELYELNDAEYQVFRDVVSKHSWDFFKKEVGDDIWNVAIDWLNKQPE